MANDIPIPTEIEYHRTTRVLHIVFDDRSRFALPAEYLRVHSPSAEVRGHHPGQAVLQTGKAEVGIDAIEPVGTYGVLLKFDDGHDTGIFTWEWLHDLGKNYQAKWAEYVEKLKLAGASRFPGA